MNENYSWQVRMARMYISEARATKFRSWKLTLLGYASARRRKAIQFLEKKVTLPEPIKTGQLDMFGGF